MGKCHAIIADENSKSFARRMLSIGHQFDKCIVFVLFFLVVRFIQKKSYDCWQPPFNKDITISIARMLKQMRPV